NRKPLKQGKIFIKVNLLYPPLSPRHTPPPPHDGAASARPEVRAGGEGGRCRAAVGPPPFCQRRRAAGPGFGRSQAAPPFPSPPFPCRGGAAGPCRVRGEGGGGSSTRHVGVLGGGAGAEAVGAEQLSAERADAEPVAHPPPQALGAHRQRVGAGAAQSESDESCKKHLGRVLSIWEERSVYENDVLEQLRQALYGDRKVRKRTYEQIKVDENNCSPRSSPTDPPQTTDLIRALQELENAASGDAAVHQRIASLPLEVQDVSLLDRITDKESGEQLSKMVDDACMLLADYNGRLAAEIDDRKQLTRMLSDFLRCQKEFLAEKEHKLEGEEYQPTSHKIDGTHGSVDHTSN
uniref:Regulation of nuclear pre-mRNA domain containing 1A n=1 Tax=Anas zonorhyncha TaxID=75864 RepID=A0A8B9VHV4_9AVES